MKKITKKNNNYRTNIILGVKIDFISCSQALSLVENWVNTNKQYQITTPNPEHIVIAQDDYRFKNIINNSALRIADGVGLVWAGKRSDPAVAGSDLNNHRLSGMDLMLALCKLSTQKKWRVFLLGGRNNAAKKAAEKLVSLCHSERSPALRDEVEESSEALNIQYFNGSSNIQNETSTEQNEAINRINKFQPHLLFVAFGAPAQEKWIAKNLPKLKVNAAMGVGGSFDYLAGIVKRAPQWVRKAGLEWLWRFWHEPWRWRRQVRLLKFVCLVIKERFC